MSTVEILIPASLQKLFKPKRRKIAFGGRGGAKTENFGGRGALLAMMQGKNVICFRQFKEAINKSIYSTHVKIINTYKLNHLFDIKSNRIIYKQNGAYMDYLGLDRNIDSIQGLDNYDIAIVDEAHAVSQKAFDKLTPTIRKSGSEIWIMYNPNDEFDPVHDSYVRKHMEHIRKHGYYEDEMNTIVRVNYDSNPFFPFELKMESDELKKNNYKKWLWIYGGECFGDYEDSIIQPEWFDAALDAIDKLNITPRGSVVGGFDPADRGYDHKGLVVRHGVSIEHFERWHQEKDLEESCDFVGDTCRKLQVDHLVYDAVGVGAGAGSMVSRYLGDASKMVCQPFKGSESVDFPDRIAQLQEFNAVGKQPTNKETYRNKRAQYAIELANRFYKTYRWVEHNEVCDPEEIISINSRIDDLSFLKSQCIKIQRVRRSGNSLVQIEDKEIMKKEYDLPSPEGFDSLCMAFANMRQSNIEARKPAKKRLRSSNGNQRARQARR